MQRDWNHDVGGALLPRKRAQPPKGAWQTNGQAGPTLRISAGRWPSPPSAYRTQSCAQNQNRKARAGRRCKAAPAFAHHC